MTEELNHCEQQSPLNSHVVVEIHDAHFQNTFVVGPPDSDHQADVESLGQSPDGSDSDWVSSPSSDVNNGNFKTLQSPLTALNFPPPPPIEEGDFDNECDASSTDSLSFESLDFQSIADRIVSAAIQEAVLIETVVTMAMRDAVAALILKVNPLQEEECKTEEKAETLKPETENKDHDAKSISSTNSREKLDNLPCGNENEKSDERKFSSRHSSPSKTTEENLVEVDKTVPINESQVSNTESGAKSTEILRENTPFNDEPTSTENVKAESESNAPPVQITTEKVENKVSEENQTTDEDNQPPKEEESSVVDQDQDESVHKGETEKVEVEINHKAEEAIKPKQKKAGQNDNMAAVVAYQTTDESTVPKTKTTTPAEPEIEATNPEVETTEPTNPKNQTTESAKPETQTTESAKPEIQATEPEPTKPEAQTSEPMKPKAFTTEPTKPESQTAKPVKPEFLAAKSAKPESQAAKPAKPDVRTKEPSKLRVTEPTTTSSSQAAFTTVEQQPKATASKKSGCCIIV